VSYHTDKADAPNVNPDCDPCKKRGLRVPAHYIFNGVHYCRPCWQHRNDLKPAGENTAGNTAAGKEEAMAKKCKCGRDLGHSGRHRGGLSPHKADATTASRNLTLPASTTDYHMVLAKLEAERRKHAAEIEKLDAAIEAVKALVG
jgi:hypothetical protein